MRLLRPYRKVPLREWREFWDYHVYGGDFSIRQICVGELLELPASMTTVAVSNGRAASNIVSVSTPHPGEVLICERDTGGEGGADRIELRWISEADARERVLRFDRPPYVGGARVGRLSALGVSTVALLGGLAVLVWAVTVILVSLGTPNPAKVFVALVVMIPLSMFFMMAGILGFRGLRAYSKLPPTWKH